MSEYSFRTVWGDDELPAVVRFDVDPGVPRGVDEPPCNAAVELVAVEVIGTGEVFDSDSIDRELVPDLEEQAWDMLWERDEAARWAQVPCELA